MLAQAWARRREGPEELLRRLRLFRPMVFWDTGALMSAVLGVDYTALSAASFVQSYYRKVRSLVREWWRHLPVLRREYVGQMEKKEEAGSIARAVMEYCWEHPNLCVVTPLVRHELALYSDVFPSLTTFLELLSGKDLDRLAMRYNEAIERQQSSNTGVAGVSRRVPRRQMVNPAFFKSLASEPFNWGRGFTGVSEGEIARWDGIVENTASRLGVNLSATDKELLALTAAMNASGQEALVVTADGGMHKVASELGIPHVYIYSGPRIEFEYNLGGLKPPR